MASLRLTLCDLLYIYIDCWVSTHSTMGKQSVMFTCDILKEA